MISTEELIDQYRELDLDLTDKQLIFILASDLRNLMIRTALAENKNDAFFNTLLYSASRIAKMKIKLEELNHDGLVTEDEILNIPDSI